MYFLQQLKTQFFATLYSFQVGGGPEDTNNGHKDPNAVSQISADDKKKLDALNGLGESIDDLEKTLSDINASEKVVSQRVAALGSSMEKIANGQIPGLSPSDPEYKELKAKHDAFLAEYKALTKEGAAVHHIVNHRLSELGGHVDTLAQKPDVAPTGNVDEKEFLPEEITQLQEQKNEFQKRAEQTFITYLGDKVYDGGDLSAYQERFTGQVGENYKSYLEAVKDSGKSGVDIAHDIQVLDELTSSNLIEIRDKQTINEKLFGDIRNEKIRELYTALLETKDEQILNIISPILNGSERTPTAFSDISIVQIGALRAAGYDARQLFLLNVNGKQFSAEEFAGGKEMIVNLGGNENIASDMELHFIEEGLQNLKVEGKLATYKTDGESGPGYYSESGPKIVLQDGLKIQAVDGESPVDSARKAATDTAVKKAMESGAISQALQNPEGQINTKTLWGKLVMAILNALSTEELKANEDGILGTYTENGTFQPFTGRNVFDKYSGSIRSYGVEKSSSGTTLCSRTAAKNLKMLGVRNPKTGDAHNVVNTYTGEKNLGFPKDISSSATRVDLFLDASKDSAAKGYKHRAVAFKDGKGNWQVLDPYYRMGRPESQRTAPVSAERYMNYMRGTLGKKFHGAFEV